MGSAYSPPGHPVTHLLELFCANDPLGQVVTHVLEVGSAKVFQSAGQPLTQLWVLFEPYRSGEPGQVGTHVQVELSAYRNGLLEQVLTQRDVVGSAKVEYALQLWRQRRSTGSEAK
jgi:hypothetical protein